MRAITQDDCEDDAQLEEQHCGCVCDVMLRALGCPERPSLWELQAFGVGRGFYLAGFNRQRPLAIGQRGSEMVKISR